MAWPAGDTSKKLRVEISSFIMFWIYSPEYKSRLPRQHIKTFMQGEKQDSGVAIVIVTDKQEADAWVYSPTSGEHAGQGVFEEYHSITLVFKADKSSGAVESLSQVHSTVKSLMLSRPESDERMDLIDRGIYNLFESNEGIEVEPGSDDDEGTYYSQRINLTCSTESLLK